MKKIALEEHFLSEDFLPYTEKADFAFMKPDLAKSFKEKLLDFDDLRLKEMDEADIEISVLSLTDPGLQGELDVATAIKLAPKGNDFLAEKIDEHPERYRGFAQLPMQDPLFAARELDRCITELRFVGTLINGQTGGRYLDDAMYYPFWDKVVELDIPVYLHPGSPVRLPDNMRGREELAGALWGWTAETATHALRLVTSGLFDRYPTLKIILGHMGETLPYLCWRLDSRWQLIPNTRLEKKPSQYIKENFWITTSGVCSNEALLCAIAALGTERVMFSVDYPYESTMVAAQFMEQAPIGSNVRHKVAYDNAKRLLKL